VWSAKSCLTEAIYERSERFALFLSNAQEGDCGKMGGEHVRKDVETVDRVKWKGC